MDSWAKGIDAVTLFAEDLAAAKQFYLDVFGLPLHHEDDSSVVFRFGGTLINLLDATEAPDLIAPAPVAPPEAGSRMQLTIAVGDVDAMRRWCSTSSRCWSTCGTCTGCRRVRSASQRS